MRTLDAAKRERIIAAATRLFATRPFDRVRLGEVAQEAGVAKGTVYLHYKSKEDLYLSLLYEGFSSMVERLLACPAAPGDTAEQRLKVVVDELVAFCFEHPQFFELSRRTGVPVREPRWVRKRQEFFDFVEREIRRGIRRRELSDPRPDLTARYIPSMIRAAMLFPSGRLTERSLSRHILGSLLHGICRRP